MIRGVLGKKPMDSVSAAWISIQPLTRLSQNVRMVLSFCYGSAEAMVVRSIVAMVAGHSSQMLLPLHPLTTSVGSTMRFGAEVKRPGCGVLNRPRRRPARGSYLGL